MDATTLQTYLDQAEAALHMLMTGSREQEIAMADGRRVMYGAVNRGDLERYIASLKSQLAAAKGDTCNQRRPIYFQF